MTDSWKGRGNQYFQFVRVLYCKLPTNGKQLPAFLLESVPASEVGGESVTTLSPWPLPMPITACYTTCSMNGVSWIIFKEAGG